MWFPQASLYSSNVLFTFNIYTNGHIHYSVKRFFLDFLQTQMPKADVTYGKWKAKEGHIILNWIKILPPNQTWLSMPEDFERQFSCHLKRNTDFYTIGNNEQITALPNGVKALKFFCYKF